MYKINPSFISQESWWTPICRITCKNWPMMPASLINGTSPSSDADFFRGVCNSSEINDTAGAEPQFSYLLALLFGVPATLIIIITVFGNFLVLCFKAKVGKRQTMLLIWNLGLADFLVGVFVLPLGVSYVIGRRWPFGRLLCRIWVSCDVIFCTASIVTLCIISVDRYIGVTRPLRYKLIVTKTKVVISIIAIWIFSICILLATIRYHSDDDYCFNPAVCHAGNELEYVIHSVVFAFFLPTSVTLFLYWKIYIVAKRREKGLAQGLILAMGQNFFKECFAIPLRIHCGKDTMSQQQQVIRMHKRVAKTLGVVVSAFVVCWCPFFSLYIIGYQCGGCIPSLVLDITSWLGYCNSMINPVIYAFTVDEFKRTLQLLFCSFWYRRAARRASAQPDQNRQTASRTTCSLYPQASTLPRSNRAYSLVPAHEGRSPSVFSHFSRKSDHEQSTQTATCELLTRVKARNNSSVKRRYSKRSRRSATSVGTVLPDDWPTRARKRQSIDEAALAVPPPSLENGKAGNPIDQLDLDDAYGGNVEDPIWNAKLYCTLISSQSTGL